MHRRDIPVALLAASAVAIALGGTSIAAPLVSGAALLLKSLRPAATHAEIRTALRATAVDKGTPGEDDQFGAGLLDVHAALHAVDPSFVPNAPN